MADNEIPPDSGKGIGKAAAMPDRGYEPNLPWAEKRSLSNAGGRRRSSERRLSITRAPPGKKWWEFKLRPWDDDQEQNWWFAGTAIPLLAATIGPLANVLSIAALVTYWRMCLVDGTTDAAACVLNANDTIVGDLYGKTFADPHWYVVFPFQSL